MSDLLPKTVYSMCGFDIILQNRTDRFCSLLEPSDFEVFEYHKDLKLYYTNGYRFDIDWKMSTRLLQTVHQSLSDFHQKNKTGLFMFAHVGTLVPFYAMLGLFNDSEPLTAGVSDTFRRLHKWRSSKMVPFGANLMFMTYDCGNAEPMIKLLLNENETIIPACNDLYCPLSQFSSFYKEKLSL
eukprot:675550_1